jgi:hypothetical protein
MLLTMADFYLFVKQPDKRAGNFILMSRYDKKRAALSRPPSSAPLSGARRWGVSGVHCGARYAVLSRAKHWRPGDCKRHAPWHSATGDL